MYGRESWTIKKAEYCRIDAFELWCWRRLVRVPWTARKPYQSILKEINPAYSLKGLMLKLKLQYLATWCKEPTHWKRPWCWERLKAWGGYDRGWNGIMDSKDLSLSQLWEILKDRKPGMLQSMRSQRVEQGLLTERQQEEAEFKPKSGIIYCRYST